MACLMHIELLFPVSLRQCSELGEKEEKIASFPLPNPPLGSHRSPIFFLFNAVFRLERFTEVREFTYPGKHFPCVNAN